MPVRSTSRPSTFHSTLVGGFFPKAAVVLTAAFSLSACQSPRSDRVGPPSASSRPQDALEIRFTQADDRSGFFIDVVGLPADTLRTLQQRPPAEEDWPALLRVSIGDVEGGSDLPAVAGRYSVTATGIRFSPLYPLDAGRAYRVTLDPSRFPRAGSQQLTASAEQIGRAHV